MTRDAQIPVNVILADQTIVLFWVLGMDGFEQYDIENMKAPDCVRLTIDGCLLEKQFGFFPAFVGATFELDGSAYVIDSAALSAEQPIAAALRRVTIQATSYFPD